MELEATTEELGKKKTQKTPHTQNPQQHKKQVSQLCMPLWNILLFQLRRILFSP